MRVIRPGPDAVSASPHTDRRTFVGAGLLGALATALGPSRAEARSGLQPQEPAAAGGLATDRQFGLIGRIEALPDERDTLIAILVNDLSSMPGCLSYIVARDPADETAIWVTEAWESEAAQQASLELDSVRSAIARARPLIAGMSSIARTEPVGGHGLVRACFAPY